VGAGRHKGRRCADEAAGADVLKKWPVSRRVNSSRAPDDDASLIESMREGYSASVGVREIILQLTFQICFGSKDGDHCGRWTHNLGIARFCVDELALMSGGGSPSTRPLRSACSTEMP
jgi:hypothetical protein